MIPVKQIKNIKLGDYSIVASSSDSIKQEIVQTNPGNAGIQTISSNIKINGNFAAGTAVSANADNTIALGISAIASEPNTFVWNGVSSELFNPHNGSGTFNLNTGNGIKDIFIDNVSLYQIVQEIALELQYGE